MKRLIAMGFAVLTLIAHLLTIIVHDSTPAGSYRSQGGSSGGGFGGFSGGHK